MLQGEFRMEMRSIDVLASHSYPVAAWYENGEKICETSLDSTLGFYCPECGTMTGIFRYTKPVGFTGRFKSDLNDDIDKLLKKSCPDCGRSLDIDYPRCPECGYIFETL
jgi:rubredoxin